LPDAAFALPSESALPALSDGAAWLEGIPKPRLAVTVIPRMVRTLEKGMMRRYLSALRDAIVEFSDQTGSNVVLLPQSCGPTPVEDDREVIRAVVDGMSGHRRLHSAIQIVPRPSTLRGLYRVMDAVLASRLHSAVFALAEQVPTLVIGYLSKSRGVMETIGLDEWVLDIDRLGEGHLLSRMLDLWQGRSRFRNILGEIIPEIRQRAALGGALIRADYDNGN
jgi:colanic acid/amylovoran biosynthesis protein